MIAGTFPRLPCAARQPEAAGATALHNRGQQTHRPRSTLIVRSTAGAMDIPHTGQPNAQHQQSQPWRIRQPAQELRASRTSRPPEVRAQAASNDRDNGVAMSMFWPHAKLPPDGKTRTQAEELCDPMERSCQTPMHVWETRCKACNGTGSVRASGNGRRRGAFCTCVPCSGIGYVRKTSSRSAPQDVNNGTGDFTLARPQPPQPKQPPRR